MCVVRHCRCMCAHFSCSGYDEPDGLPQWPVGRQFHDARCLFRRHDEGPVGDVAFTLVNPGSHSFRMLRLWTLAQLSTPSWSGIDEATSNRLLVKTRHLNWQHASWSRRPSKCHCKLTELRERSGTARCPMFFGVFVGAQQSVARACTCVCEHLTVSKVVRSCLRVCVRTLRRTSSAGAISWLVRLPIGLY